MIQHRTIVPTPNSTPYVISSTSNILLKVLNEVFSMNFVKTLFQATVVIHPSLEAVTKYYLTGLKLEDISRLIYQQNINKTSKHTRAIPITQIINY